MAKEAPMSKTSSFRKNSWLAIYRADSVVRWIVFKSRFFRKKNNWLLRNSKSLFKEVELNWSLVLYTAVCVPRKNLTRVATVLADGVRIAFAP